MEPLGSDYWGQRVERLRERAALIVPQPEASRLSILDGDELEALSSMALDLDEAKLLRWSSVVPAKFVDARLDVFPVDIQEIVLGWCAKPGGRALAITGPTGVGKTHLAVAAGRELHLASREVRFASVAWLWHKLRPPGDDALLEAVCDVDVLILDDLGSEKASEWTKEQLWIISNQRWAEDRPTIFTTNLPWSDLKATLGDRVYDRLVNAATVRLMMVGQSHRRMT